MTGLGKPFLMPLTALLAVLLMPPPAAALKIGDITHLQGTRTNLLLGMGFVVGLKGTGDGGKYLPTMRLLAQEYRIFGVPVISFDELKDAKNVALVQVEATLPRDGVREGERVDVKVSSVGAAKSLAGGRLLLVPLVSPNLDDPGGPMAMAAGPVQIEDPQVPTVGRIAQGATLEQDWIHNYVALGRDLAVYQKRSAVRPLSWIRPDEPYVTFVIDQGHSELGIAVAIAQSINEETSIPQENPSKSGEQIARAFDAHTVIVRIPEVERANPAPFLHRLERLQLWMPFAEARVTINRRSGSIVITGDVEISPAVVSHKGLTITTLVPEPEATPENPRMVEKDFIVVSSQAKDRAKLADLEEALNKLRVPAEDRITIIEQLHKTGKLHATLIVEQ